MRNTVISAVPWVGKVILWFLPSTSLDIMIYFMLALLLTECTTYGVYHLPLEHLSKKTKKLRMVIASKLSEFNFRIRKKKSVKTQVQIRKKEG